MLHEEMPFDRAAAKGTFADATVAQAGSLQDSSNALVESSNIQKSY